MSAYCRQRSPSFAPKQRGNAVTILYVVVFHDLSAANTSERSRGAIGVEVMTAAIFLRCPASPMNALRTICAASATRSSLRAISSFCRSSNSTRSGRSEPRTSPRALPWTPTAAIIAPEVLYFSPVFLPFSRFHMVGRTISFADRRMSVLSPWHVCDRARWYAPPRRRSGTETSGKSCTHFGADVMNATMSAVIAAAFFASAETDTMYRRSP